MFFRCINWLDAGDGDPISLAVVFGFFALGEFDNASRKSEKRVVIAPPHIGSGMNFRAALSDDYRAVFGKRAVGDFYAEPLSVRIAA